MESVLDNPMVVVTVIVGAAVTLFAYVLTKFLHQDNKQGNKIKNEKVPARPTEKKKEPAAGKNKKKAEPRWSGRSEKQNFSHPWLLTSLKGHTGRVLGMDFAANGKYLASVADDRTIFLWDTKDFTQKDRKSLRVNVEFDYGTLVRWSPDSKAVVIHRYNENCMEVFKVEKKKDGWIGATKAVTFPKCHETDVIGMGIASTGKYIMSCSNKTDLTIWDLKGEILAKIDTYLMNTTCAKVSPCGRFVVASGFTPEARVWEVNFDKSGEFKEIKQVVPLTLAGHTSGIYDIAFDVDSSHMATVSKDGTWRLFDTNVNYKQGQDARFIRSGKYEPSGSHAFIALSPNSEVVVIATASDLQFFSALTGELDSVIENVFSDNATSILFDATGKFVLVSGDKQIKVFHNVTGYRTGMENAREKLKEHQTSATKERLQKLLVENQEFLDKIENK